MEISPQYSPFAMDTPSKEKTTPEKRNIKELQVNTTKQNRSIETAIYQTFRHFYTLPWLIIYMG
jgi:hypothetical protein